MRIDHQHFASIASTHLYAKEQLSTLLLGQWRLYTADLQSAGIGTKNRSWLSPKVGNIYASYSFLIEQITASELLLMPQVACLSVLELLAKHEILARIKWVNDVLVNRAKIAGILMEKIALSGAKQSAVICSIGLNVNAAAGDLLGVGQNVTSMYIEKGARYDLEQLTCQLSKILIAKFSTLAQSGGQQFVWQIAANLEKFNDAPVSICRDDGSTVCGIVIGLSDSGKLLLQTANGVIQIS
jgi:BirA family biotin operon repressor/biotin-[acetyl-CoA-carboxylase] ligase